MLVGKSVRVVREDLQDADRGVLIVQRQGDDRAYSQLAANQGIDARVVLRILATQDAIGTQAFSRDSGVGVEARPQRRGIGATTGAADDSIVFRAKQRKRRTGGA